MTIKPPQPTLAGRKEWTALAVLILPLLLVSMDVSVLYFAVPFISADINPTATEQLWIFDVYGFVLAGLLLTMGSLGDRIGRRRLLLIGAAAFGLASLGAAYAPNAQLLIAARAVLGIAGATLMPSTLALVRNMFLDAAQRSKAIAIWTAVLTGGIAIGPVLSGVLLEHFWWGSVFLINIPAMVLLLVLGPILLPEFRAAAPGRFDLASSVLSLAAVLPVIYGIKEWAAYGFRLGYLGAILGGLVVGSVFLVRQRRLADPMLDLGLFSHRGFAGSVLASVISMFALVGNAVFLTQYLQSVLGLSPLVAALWSLAPSVFVGAAAPTAAALAQRMDRGFVLAGGFVMSAAGFVVLTRIQPHSSLVWVLIGAALISSGLVAVLTLVTDVALGTVQPERAGAASAVMETGSEFGGALGIAVLGSIGAAIYGSRLSATLPAGLPPAAATTAQETLAGATVAARQLGGARGSSLLEAARDAFIDSLHGTAWVAAAMLVTAAALSAVFLRRLTVGSTDQGQRVVTEAEQGVRQPS